MPGISGLPSGYGGNLRSKRTRFQIPAPDTKWTIPHMYLLSNIVKTLKMNSKETLDGPFLKKYGSKTIFLSKTVRRC